MATSRRTWPGRFLTIRLSRGRFQTLDHERQYAEKVSAFFRMGPGINLAKYEIWVLTLTVRLGFGTLPPEFIGFIRLGPKNWGDRRRKSCPALRSASADNRRAIIVRVGPVESHPLKSGSQNNSRSRIGPRQRPMPTRRCRYETGSPARWKIARESPKNRGLTTEKNKSVLDFSARRNAECDSALPYKIRCL